MFFYDFFVFCGECGFLNVECYCDFCNISLCVLCVGKYLLDFIKIYNVVFFILYKYDRFDYIFVRCLSYIFFRFSNKCECFCKKCNVFVCFKSVFRSIYEDYELFFFWRVLLELNEWNVDVFYINVLINEYELIDKL